MTRAAEAAWLEQALTLLADTPPALRVRLPELEREGKRVVREVQVRQVGGSWIATYAERSGDVGAPFKPVCSDVLEDIIDALAWGESCGY